MAPGRGTGRAVPASPRGNTPSVTSPALPGHLSTAPGVTQQSSRGRCRWFYTWDCAGSFLLSVLVSTWSDRLGRGKWWLPACAWAFPKKSRLFLVEDPPQSQRYSYYIHLLWVTGRWDRPLEASSFCLQPRTFHPSILERDTDAQVQHP